VEVFAFGQSGGERGDDERYGEGVFIDGFGGVFLVPLELELFADERHEQIDLVVVVDA
jgi:hypothetical protein